MTTYNFAIEVIALTTIFNLRNFLPTYENHKKL